MKSVALCLAFLASPVLAQPEVPFFWTYGGSVSPVGMPAVNPQWVGTTVQPTAGWNSDLNLPTTAWSAPRRVTDPNAPAGPAELVWQGGGAMSCSSASRFCWLRGTFDLQGQVVSATLRSSSDDDHAVWINGVQVVFDADCRGGPLQVVDVTGILNQGANLVAVSADDCRGVCHSFWLSLSVASVPIGQANSQDASLIINGMANAGSGPFSLGTPSGAALTLDWNGPSGGVAVLATGPLRSVPLVISALGTLHLGDPLIIIATGLSVDPFSSQFLLGASGMASVTIPGGTLPPGTSVTVQGAILAPGGSSALTAAWSLSIL